MSYAYNPNGPNDPADVYTKVMNAPRNESYDHFPQPISSTDKWVMGISAAVAVYAWFKCPWQLKLWLFLIFLGIPIPALLCADHAPIAAIGLVILWFYVLIKGMLWAFRQDDQYWAAQRAEQDQAVREAERQQVQALFADARRQEAAMRRQADMTGQAIVDAMKQAVRQDAAQSPSAPSQPRNNVVDPPALPPGPQSPTGPSQRPSAPPPAPPAPMGTSTSPLWVPTYHGKAKPVQRTETSLGGTVMRDRRSVDPDTL